MSLIDIYARGSDSWTDLPRKPDAVANVEGRERERRSGIALSGGRDGGPGGGGGGDVDELRHDPGVFAGRKGRKTLRSVLFAYRPPRGVGGLELEVGDLVDVLETFEDGKALGMNRRTGQTGYFPLSHLSDTPYTTSSSSSSSGSSARTLTPRDADTIFKPNTSNNTTLVRQHDSVGGEEARYDYTPEAWYEVPVHAGDRVDVWELFEDGWGFGVVFDGTTTTTGLFPLGQILPTPPSITTPTRRTRRSALADPRSLMVLGGGPSTHAYAKLDFCLRGLGSGTLSRSERRVFGEVAREVEGRVRGRESNNGRSETDGSVATDQW
ncbi:hypothetical protein HK104_000922 [Borealophlyctis nickersoniae]|nr:hypothetical protein HK104_000922 [Borealophlyctis nickersoniae]